MISTVPSRLKSSISWQKDRGETLSQLAIQWLWQQKGVTSVLVGVHSKAQLLENLAALEQPPLSEADLIRIDSYSK